MSVKNIDSPSLYTVPEEFDDIIFNSRTQQVERKNMIRYLYEKTLWKYKNKLNVTTRKYDSTFSKYM